MCLLLSTPFPISLQNHVTPRGTGRALWFAMDCGPQLRSGPFHRSSPVTFGLSSDEASLIGGGTLNIRRTSARSPFAGAERLYPGQHKKRGCPAKWAASFFVHRLFRQFDAVRIDAQCFSHLFIYYQLKCLRELDRQFGRKLAFFQNLQGHFSCLAT